MIALLQQGLIQQDLLRRVSHEESLHTQLSHCTRAHVCLNKIRNLCDAFEPLSLQHAALLAAADTAATNVGGVVKSVHNFHVRSLNNEVLHGVEQDGPPLKATPMHSLSLAHDSSFKT